MVCRYCGELLTRVTKYLFVCVNDNCSNRFELEVYFENICEVEDCD